MAPRLFDARVTRTSALTNTVLVVHVGDLAQAESFLVVQMLFLFQNPLVEELLQLFVTVVDTELFEAVHGEIL